jgi:hypothetical protein
MFAAIVLVQIPLPTKKKDDAAKGKRPSPL